MKSKTKAEVCVSALRLNLTVGKLKKLVALLAADNAYGPGKKYVLDNSALDCVVITSRYF